MKKSIVVRQSISRFSLCSYLAYWISRTNQASLDFFNLPIEISAVPRGDLRQAFADLHQGGIIQNYVFCCDGIDFSRARIPADRVLGLCHSQNKKGIEP